MQNKIKQSLAAIKNLLIFSFIQNRTTTFQNHLIYYLIKPEAEHAWNGGNKDISFFYGFCMSGKPRW